MTIYHINFLLLGFVLGMWFGGWLTDRLWRSKGDNEYMNTIASGGKLYDVKVRK